MEKNSISGGCFQIARKIFESWIWSKPPYYFKLWIWLIGKCNHKTTVKFGQTFNKGECLVTLSETAKQTEYKVGYRTERISKDKAWRFYEDLRKQSMISTMNTTAGMFVKVFNYNTYQNFQNYEHNNDQTMTQRCRDIINKNEKNEKNKNISCTEKISARQKMELRISKIPEEAKRLSKILLNLILENRSNTGRRFQKIKPEHLISWAEDIDKLNRIDEIPWEDIEEVIRFAQGDDFWWRNICSGSKLRKKYSTLVQRMGTPENNQKTKAEEVKKAKLTAQEEMKMKLLGKSQAVIGE